MTAEIEGRLKALRGGSGEGMTRLCVNCGYPLLDARRQKTCGELCSKEWQRRYHAQYHQDHIEKRREACRKSWAKHAAKHAKRTRKPLTPEQRAQRQERQRRIRATAEWKERCRQKRANWTPEQRERHLAQQL